MRRILSDADPTDQDRERARLALKLTSEGTKRMSAETNRAEVAFKIMQTMGGDLKSMKPIVGNLIASGEEPQEPASEKSEGN